MNNPIIKYDEISDTLTICFIPGRSATGIELTDHILLRINYQERQPVSIVIFEYSVLAQKTNIGERSFPITGLSHLTPEMSEIVFDILQQKPVNDFLRLSAYTLSLVEIVPIISLQSLSLAAI